MSRVRVNWRRLRPGVRYIIVASGWAALLTAAVTCGGGGGNDRSGEPPTVPPPPTVGASVIAQAKELLAADAWPATAEDKRVIAEGLRAANQHVRSVRFDARFESAPNFLLSGQATSGVASRESPLAAADIDVHGMLERVDQPRIERIVSFAIPGKPSGAIFHRTFFEPAATANACLEGYDAGVLPDPLFLVPGYSPAPIPDEVVAGWDDQGFVEVDGHRVRHIRDRGAAGTVPTPAPKGSAPGLPTARTDYWIDVETLMLRQVAFGEAPNIMFHYASAADEPETIEVPPGWAEPDPWPVTDRTHRDPDRCQKLSG